MSWPNTLLLQQRGYSAPLYSLSSPAFMLQLASLATFTHQSLLRADITHYPRKNVVVFQDSAGLVS